MNILLDALLERCPCGNRDGVTVNGSLLVCDGMGYQTVLTYRCARCRAGFRPGGKHRFGCPCRASIAEAVWEIGCPARHPQADRLRCFREFAHRANHQVQDWNSEIDKDAKHYGLTRGWAA